MMRKLHHPLWTHLPVVSLYAAVLVALGRAVPLPSQVPMQFNWAGETVRWGSPWEFASVAVLLPLGLIVLGVFADESWARTEARKRFSWTAVVDEVVVGSLAGTLIPYCDMLRSGGTRLSMPWGMMLALAAGAGGLATVLELLRPWRPVGEPVRISDRSRAEQEIGARMRAGERWVYWEVQNPAYMSLLVFGVTGGLLVGAWHVWKVLPWVAPEMAIAAAALLLLYGGQRVTVTRERVEVRLGLLGLRLLRVPLSEMAGVEVRSFSPLGDFGGWGIRYGRGTHAFFWRGNRGVQVRTNGGRQYLIGSDDAERLAAVIGAAREAAAASP
jgi:hypothetical protein